MNQGDHVVKILTAGRLLQREMARTYDPDRNAITALCQEIETSAHALYAWANGIEEEING